jgi:hypothetical protein
MNDNYDVDFTPAAADSLDPKWRGAKERIESRGADLLAEFGLEGWKVLVKDAHDMGGALGLCSPPAEKQIWVDIDCDPRGIAEDTIRHEIAHAFAPDDENHGPEWVAAAKRAGCSPHAKWEGPSYSPFQWLDYVGDWNVERQNDFDEERELRAKAASAENRGRVLLKRFGLEGWKVIVVHEQHDTGDDDDIRGSYGRCIFDDKLIWVNGRYAGSPELVEDIIRHEIAHALLQGGADHGLEFVEMARKVGCTQRSFGRHEEV